MRKDGENYLGADERIREGVTRCFGPRRLGTISMLELARLDGMSAKMRIVRRGESPTEGAIDAELLKRFPAPDLSMERFR